MSSALAPQKLSSRLATGTVTNGATSLAAGAYIWSTWLDFSAYQLAMFLLTNITLTGTGYSAAAIYVAIDNAGTGAALVRSAPLAQAPAAASIQSAVECIATELDAVLAAGRYLNLKVTCANASDVVAATYIFGNARFPNASLTNVS